MGDTEKEECIDCTVEPPPGEGGASRARLLCGRGRLFLNGRVSVSRPVHTPRLPPRRPPPPTTYHGCSITHMEWGQCQQWLAVLLALPKAAPARALPPMPPCVLPIMPVLDLMAAAAAIDGHNNRQPAQQQPRPVPFVLCRGPFFALHVHVCSPRVLALVHTALPAHNLGLLLIIISATTTTRGVPPTPPPTPRAAPWTRRWDLGA